MDLSDRELFDLARYAFTRLDGAWFLGAAEKLGVETAWELDVEAWRRFAYVLGKRIKSELIPEPVWPDSFLDAMAVFSRLLMIGGREVTVKDGVITVRVTDCEMRRMIVKAGVAECGIATTATYQSMAEGIFGKDVGITVEHTKNLDRGDDICEVCIARDKS